MAEITLVKCKNCGVLHPADAKHECDIRVLHGYELGFIDGVKTLYEELRIKEFNTEMDITCDSIPDIFNMYLDSIYESVLERCNE